MFAGWLLRAQERYDHGDWKNHQADGRCADLGRCGRLPLGRCSQRVRHQNSAVRASDIRPPVSDGGITAGSAKSLAVHTRDSLSTAIRCAMASLTPASLMSEICTHFPDRTTGYLRPGEFSVFRCRRRIAVAIRCDSHQRAKVTHDYDDRADPSLRRSASPGAPV